MTRRPWSPLLRWRRGLGPAAALLCLAASAPAQQEGDASSAAELAREFSDPLTSLPQLFLQNVYTPSSYGTRAHTNRVIVRAIVPRVPKFSLLPFVQLIRPTFQLVTVPTGKGGGTRTELGDVQLFDFAVLPWPKRIPGLYLAVGPVFVFPTATHETAGQGAWQVGPGFGALYKGIPGVLLGLLVQNPISFAYTSRDRDAVSTLLVQPVFLTYIGKGFYVKSADSSWSFGWHDDAPTLVPVSFGIGHVTVREGRPPINIFLSGEWTAYRKSAPIAPQTTIRLGMTVAFPQFRPW
jgi:hypothetical protein